MIVADLWWLQVTYRFSWYGNTSHVIHRFTAYRTVHRTVHRPARNTQIYCVQVQFVWI